MAGLTRSPRLNCKPCTPPPASLPDAACRLIPNLMDGETLHDIATALQVCRHCLELDPCHTWAVKNVGLQGVVGGNIYGEARKTWMRRHRKAS